MNKIPYFYLQQLHNAENINFHNESAVQIELAPAILFENSSLPDEYRISRTELHDTIDVFSAGKLSNESLTFDTLRDKAYSALKAYVKVYLNDSDDSKVEAAERIIDVIRKSALEIGNPLLLGSAKESVALESLLRNLEPLAADINLIGAAVRLQNLREANQAFIDLQPERIIGKSEKHTGDVKAARVKADAVYNRIVEWVNAKITVTGDMSFEPYVKAQTTVIEKYKTLVAQRKGRKNSEK